MAEDLTLDTPISKPPITTWRVERLDLNYAPGASTIGIYLIGSDGSHQSYGYSDLNEAGVNTGVATALLSSLNTVNLSVKSLQRRVLERVALDFPESAGSVVGTPF